jgi:hypothetical protein
MACEVLMLGSQGKVRAKCCPIKSELGMVVAKGLLQYGHQECLTAREAQGHVYFGKRIDC